MAEKKIITKSKIPKITTQDFRQQAEMVLKQRMSRVKSGQTGSHYVPDNNVSQLFLLKQCDVSK